MIEIRRPTKEDWPQLLELVHEFQKDTLNSMDMFCDDNIAYEVMNKHLDTSLVLLLDGKIIGELYGFITNYFLSNALIYQTMSWFVTKRYRKYGVRLLKELERKCAEQNIKTIILSHINNKRVESLERFYASCGYDLLETHYFKSL